MRLGKYEMDYTMMTLVITFIIISFWQSSIIWIVPSIVSFILGITKINEQPESTDRGCDYED